MRHDHVAVRAGALVERAARADRQRLGDVDLHVVDVLAVPQRLEEAVGEPQREQVQRRLLAEEVVDPEDLLLPEHLVDRVVELARRLEVGAERLLHDHARALGQPGLAERPHDRAGRGRRHRQVVQPARLAPDRLLRARDARRERVGLSTARSASRSLNGSQSSSAISMRQNSSSAPRTCSRNFSSSSSLSDVPMMR